MSIDRLERRLPEVLTELSLPRVPDYTDDLLGRTARMPQRPGWTFPERWIPMSTTFTASRPLPRAPIRPLLVLAVLLALAIAAVAVFVGTQKRLPPPFGLARNGAVLTANPAGDIVSIDPVSGDSRTLIEGPELCCAVVSPDGQRFSFLQVPAGGGPATAFKIANIDGSVTREFPAELAADANWFEWSPTSDRGLLTRTKDVVVIDVANGSVTTIETGSQIGRASWIGTTGDILLTMGGQADVVRTIKWLPAGATSLASAVEVTKLRSAVDVPLVSPDGSRFLYFIWGSTPNLHGRIHVFDFAAGSDIAVTDEAPVDPAHEVAWENPVWSPDGTRIATELYTTGENHIAVISAASAASPVLIGPAFPTGENGAAIRWSPDGTSILATYRFNNETWLLPVSGEPGRKVSWATSEDMDWQRLAP